jgi:hypothetical protein
MRRRFVGRKLANSPMIDMASLIKHLHSMSSSRQYLNHQSDGSVQRSAPVNSRTHVLDAVEVESYVCRLVTIAQSGLAAWHLIQ